MAVNLLIKKTDFEALDATLQKEYKPVAGKDDEYELDVVGGNPNVRLKEFRERNITLDQELKAEKAKWDGVGDPDDVREVMKKADDIKKGEVFKKGSAEFDKEIERRTAAMKADLEGKAAEAEKKAAAVTARLETLEIHDALVREATALNILPDAIQDFVSSQATCIKLVNGQPVVYEAADGKREVYGADSKPITIKEHVANLAKAKHWFFKPSKGADSKGTRRDGDGEGDNDNPYKPGPGYSKTKQQALEGSDDAADRDKAKRLKAAAGA